MEQRRSIRLKFVGFFPRWKPDDNLFYHLLQKHFDLQLVEEKPDFIFCQYFGTPYEYANYTCPRILYAGENYSPDFNCYDYSITYDPLEYGDRHFFAPYFLLDPYAQKIFMEDGTPPLPSKESLLAGKNLFCDFIFSHESATGMREALYEILSQYRRVESPGVFMNNMPDDWTIPYSPEPTQKMEFVGRCKFSIVAESINLSGFTSEKLTHAWLAHTVPIFFGNPDVDKIFNPKAFINVHQYASLDEVLAEVKRLDADDDAWYEMVRQPLFREESYFQRRTSELEAFLVHIFSQDPLKAYRRSRDFTPSEHDARLREYNHFLKSSTWVRYQKEKRWNQRRYWAGHWLHKCLPGVFRAPDETLLR